MVDRVPRICATLLLAHLVYALKSGTLYKMTVYCFAVYINSRVNSGCSLSAILQFYVYCTCFVLMFRYKRMIEDGEL